MTGFERALYREVAELEAKLTTAERERDDAIRERDEARRRAQRLRAAL